MSQAVEFKTDRKSEMPFCLFTDPELARVGLTEKEAKAKGIAYRLFKIPMEACCAHVHSLKPEDS